jgi:hypothetical protein
MPVDHDWHWNAFLSHPCDDLSTLVASRCDLPAALLENRVIFVRTVHHYDVDAVDLKILLDYFTASFLSSMAYG